MYAGTSRAPGTLMLLQIGQRTAPQDLVDQLVECHTRIRRFLGFARRLSTVPEADPGEAARVAGQIRRYFAVAFPLHVADENDLLLPRLHHLDAELDRALATMQHDHATHHERIERLVATCNAIERDPRQLAALAAELGALARDLTDVIEPHLELEERVIFPALRRLPIAIRDDIRTAIRHRRERLP